MELEEISKQYGVTVDELKKVEIDLRKKYESVMKIMPTEQFEKYISTGVQQHANKFKSLGLERFFGVILTLSQPRDGMSKRRSIAIKKYVEDPNMAISHGYVQEFKEGMHRFLSNGVIQTKPITQDKIPKTASYLPDQKVYILPLDERETWQNGKKNFGYLKPLPLEQYFTNIEGIASIDGTSWKPFKMIFNCNKHVNVPNIMILQSKLVKFLAKIKTQDPLVLSYNNKHTKFEIMEGDITQLNAEIMNFYDITSLSDIRKVYDLRKTNFDTYSVFGQIKNKWKKEPTDENPYPWISATINDTTCDEPLKLLMHPDVCAEFEEQSIVKVWGSLSEGNKWDPELRQPIDEKEITMFATGVYSFSNMEVKCEEEQKSDDGWES